VGGFFWTRGIYTPSQQAALDQHRLIPIEAFAWHLRHGQLQAELERYAPHLRAQLAPGLPAPSSTSAAAPPSAKGRPLKARDWLIIVLILLAIAGMFAFATHSKQNERLLGSLAGALFTGGVALQTAIGARHCFRIRSWLAGSGLGILSLTLILWTFTQLMHVGDILGKGLLAMQFFVLLLFSAVTWALAIGARRTYRRHMWFFGTLFLLAGAFTLLCAISTVVELIKSFR
jgi:hypothetical protein